MNRGVQRVFVLLKMRHQLSDSGPFSFTTLVITIQSSFQALHSGVMLPTAFCQLVKLVGVPGFLLQGRIFPSQFLFNPGFSRQNASGALNMLLICLERHKKRADLWQCDPIF